MCSLDNLELSGPVVTSMTENVASCASETAGIQQHDVVFSYQGAELGLNPTHTLNLRLLKFITLPSVDF